MRSLHTSKNTTVPSPRRKEIERESKQQLRQEAGEDEAEEVDAVLLWENDKWVVPRQLQDSEIQNGIIPYEEKQECGGKTWLILLYSIVFATLQLTALLYRGHSTIRQ